NILWYEKPASNWNEALPLGNGRLGAMVFGDVYKERIQLNDDTLWGGYPRDRHNPRAPEGLAKVRELLFEGKSKEAAAIADKTMLGVPRKIKSYLTLGDLYITSSSPNYIKIDNYRHSLDLSRAIAETTWQVDGVTFKREVFVSSVDDVCVVRITADSPGMISNKITLSRPSDAKCVSDTKDPDCIRLIGQVNEPHHETGINIGMKFESQLVALVERGKTNNSGGVIDIEKADAVTLLLATATNYRSDDPEQICRDTLAKARTKALAQMRQEHLAAHQKLFNRVSLDFGPDKNVDLPTDKRLEKIKEFGSDPGLVALYFQFGRYLLISCSRPGTMPANLQGLW
ncbi:MAG: glycoside hydrolase family 95 protein, partial [Desulfuromonadales bacterium]|nr:glycoside hydrolase family 95 protein [Desulfuromonadales bacterium]